MKNKELDEIISSMTEYNQNAVNIRRTMIRSAFIGQEGRAGRRIYSLCFASIPLLAFLAPLTNTFCLLFVKSYFFSTSRIVEEGNGESKLFPEHPLSLKCRSPSLSVFRPSLGKYNFRAGSVFCRVPEIFVRWIEKE